MHSHAERGNEGEMNNCRRSEFIRDKALCKTSLEQISARDLLG